MKRYCIGLALLLALQEQNVSAQPNTSSGNLTSLTVNEKRSVSIISDEKAQSIIKGLEDQDNEVKIRALEEFILTLKLNNTELESILEKKNHEPLATRSRFQYAAEYKLLIDTQNKFRWRIYPYIKALLESDNAAVRLTTLGFLEESYKNGEVNIYREDIIDYALKHAGDDKLCETLLNVKLDDARWRILYGAGDAAIQKCVANQKNSLEDRKKLNGYIEKFNAERQREKDERKTANDQGLASNMQFSLPIFCIIIIFSFLVAFVLVVKFSIFSLPKKIGYGALLAPLCICVVFIVYVSSSARGDGLLAILMPLLGLPAYIITLLMTCQFVIVLEYINNKQNLSLPWWIFFIIITTVNTALSFFAITGNFFFLKA